MKIVTSKHSNYKWFEINPCKYKVSQFWVSYSTPSQGSFFAIESQDREYWKLLNRSHGSCLTQDVHIMFKLLLQAIKHSLVLSKAVNLFCTKDYIYFH